MGIAQNVNATSQLGRKETAGILLDIMKEGTSLLLHSRNTSRQTR
jgi:hypothetical protein